MKTEWPILLAVMLLASSETVQAQFTYTSDNGAITLTEYTGSGGVSDTSRNSRPELTARAQFTKSPPVTLIGNVSVKGIAGTYDSPFQISLDGDRWLLSTSYKEEHTDVN
jgi:hypothetical protein